MEVTYMNTYAVVHPYKRPNDVYVQKTSVEVLAYVCIVPCMQNTHGPSPHTRTMHRQMHIIWYTRVYVCQTAFG